LTTVFILLLTLPRKILPTERRQPGGSSIPSESSQLDFLPLDKSLRPAASDVSAGFTHQPGVHRLVLQGLKQSTLANDTGYSFIARFSDRMPRPATRPQHLVSGAQAYSSRRDFVKIFFCQKRVRKTLNIHCVTGFY
jgi:hypothetical protein